MLLPVDLWAAVVFRWNFGCFDLRITSSRFQAELKVQQQQVEFLRKQLLNEAEQNAHTAEKMHASEEQKQNLEAEMESLHLKHQVELGKERIKITGEMATLQRDKNVADRDAESKSPLQGGHVEYKPFEHT